MKKLDNVEIHDNFYEMIKEMAEVSGQTMGEIIEKSYVAFLEGFEKIKDTIMRSS